MKHGINQRHCQSGYTLLEMLVAVTISIVAITGMAIMMSGTIGATTDAVTNARLTNELRSAMMILTRDLRRANISDDYLDCIATGDFECAAVTDTVNVTAGNPGCVGYSYERAGGTLNGAFRRSGNVLQLRTNSSACTDGTGWQNLTDPNIMTVTSFTVEETSGAELSYTQEVSPSLSQRVRKLRFTLEGTICHARDGGGNCTESTTRAVSNVVRIRNDTNFATP